jgi:hypothetical protein
MYIVWWGFGPVPGYYVRSAGVALLSTLLIKQSVRPVISRVYVHVLTYVRICIYV